MNELRPITREDFYMHYLAYGGEIDLLPKPFTKREEYLYKICLKIDELISNGAGGSSINVIDNLLSESTTDALSANQGRILLSKIPSKAIIELTADGMNNGLGIRYGNGDYERLQLEKIGSVGKSVKLINANSKGELSLSLQNGDLVTKQMPYVYNITSENGKAIFKFGNATQVELDCLGTATYNIEGVEELVKYYKEVDDTKVEITEEEFNNSECLTKYYKEVDGELIEITEEEFLKR